MTTIGRQQAERAVAGMLQSGIKAVDLAAPLPRGGVAGVFGPYGVGKQVLIGELIHNVASHDGSAAVWVTIQDRQEQVDDLARDLRGMGVAEHTELIAGSRRDGAAARRRLVETGLSVAQGHRDAGRAALLVVEHDAAQAFGLASLRSAVVDKTSAVGAITAVTAVVYQVGSDRLEPDAADAAQLDSWVVMDGDLFRQAIYPAVSVLASGTRLLPAADATGAAEGDQRRHRRLLESARRLLDPLRARDAVPGDGSPRAAQRLQRFLSQPFFVAEPWTGIPGQYVPLEETLSGVEALAAGRYDAIDEHAFYMVGTLGQALDRDRSA